MSVTPYFIKIEITDPNRTQVSAPFYQAFYRINNNVVSLRFVDPNTWRCESVKIPDKYWGGIFDYNGRFFRDPAYPEIPVIAFIDSDNNILDYHEAPTSGEETTIRFEIPRNTDRILYSVYVGDRQPTEFTSYILLFDDMDISDYVSGEFGIAVKQTRDKTTGVITELTIPVEFIKEGKDLIKSIYKLRGLRAEADLTVYRRDDRDLDTYHTRGTYTLYFASYKEYKDFVQIDAMSAELNQYLNSFGSTKWDIPVSEVSLPNQWHYYRQNLLNMGKYMPADNQYTYNFLTADTIVRPSISRVSAEQILGSPEHEIKTQSEGTNTSDYFFKAVDNVSVRVSMKFDYTLKWTGWQNTNDHDIYVKLVKRNGTTDTIISPAILAPVVNITPTPNNTFRITRSVSVDEAFIVDLVENDQLILVADIGANIWGQPNIPPPEGGTPIITRYRIATISNSELFTLEYTAKSSNDVLMDVAEPNAIFQALIDRAAGTPGKFTSVIEWGDLDYKPLFCAAESVRDFQEPQYHTSIDDFLKYMHYSGYEYDIVDRVITFRRRDEFFRSDIEALRLTEDECGDLLIAADNTYAYTAVRIGYNKPDYEEMNGVYEANGVYEYKTDYTDREEIKMDYVIPYRADSMGLEILLNKRDKDTEDDKGDNDVFIVAMDKEIYEETIGNTGLKRYVYVEYRDTLITYQSAPIRLEMFNAPLNPYFLVLANESLIGVNVKRLIYAGTNAAKKRDLEHNPGILITGLGSPMVDVPINKRLFAPERYNIGVGTLQELPSPDKRNGLIYFEHEGVTYKGYILESLKNELREDNSEWIIQAVG